MNSNTILFQSSNFNFKLNHLVIIGVLILAFSTSMLIRSQPIEYGFELNEFDPFFNFRATEYIVENGLSEYFEWRDDKSWYPDGRDISASSQVMLHFTAAITYQIFGGNSSLYDYTILFPAVIGSLTVVVIFALVRLFGGTTAGLIASLLFAVEIVENRCLFLLVQHNLEQSPIIPEYDRCLSRQLRNRPARSCICSDDETELLPVEV